MDMDIGTILTGIGSIGGSLGSMITGLVSNNTNKKIAEKNMQLQQAELDYQHNLQQQIFNREDTSYQRTVADMREAGLSPLSLSSINGAGATVSTTVPQNDYRNDPTAQLQSMALLAQIMPSISEAQLNDAQSNFIKAQTQGENIYNSYLEDSLKSKGKLTDLQIEAQTLSNKLADADLNYKTVENEYHKKMLDSQLDINAWDKKLKNAELTSRQLENNYNDAIKDYRVSRYITDLSNETLSQALLQLQIKVVNNELTIAEYDKMDRDNKSNFDSFLFKYFGIPKGAPESIKNEIFALCLGTLNTFTVINPDDDVNKVKPNVNFQKDVFKSNFMEKALSTMFSGLSAYKGN